MKKLRDVPEFPGYRISEAGDVWSFRPPHESGGRWLKPFRHSRAVNVRLVRDGKAYYRSPRKLAALAWYAPHPKLPWPPRPDPVETPGPFAVGSANTHAKLSEEDALRMRRLRAADSRRWTYSALAIEFGVSRSAVFHALAGLTWSHVETVPARGRGRVRKLTVEALEEMCALRAKDRKRWTYRALGQRYGVSLLTARNAISGISRAKKDPERV